MVECGIKSRHGDVTVHKRWEGTEFLLNLPKSKTDILEV